MSVSDKFPQAPLWQDFFRAHYLKRTYSKPVETSVFTDPQYSMDSHDPKSAEIARQLLTPPAVKNAFTTPLLLRRQSVSVQNNTMNSHDFSLLGEKEVKGKIMPFYSVISHRSLPGWVIKTGARRKTNEQILIGPMNDQGEVAHPLPEDSLLRVIMAETMRESSQQDQLNILIPEKKFLSLQPNPITQSPFLSFCVLSQFIKLSEPTKIYSFIRNMSAKEQKQTARRITKLIQSTGLIDLSISNLRVTENNPQLAVIDTESFGLWALKDIEGPYDHDFPPSSLEKCIRIGLYHLLQTFSQNQNQKNPVLAELLTPIEGLEPFHQEVLAQYQQLIKPKYSILKIILSIFSLGIVPLIILLYSIYLAYKAKQLVIEWRYLNDVLNQSPNGSISPSSLQELQDLPIKNLKNLESTFSLRRSKVTLAFFEMTREVPIQRKRPSTARALKPLPTTFA